MWEPMGIRMGKQYWGLYPQFYIRCNVFFDSVLRSLEGRHVLLQWGWQPKHRRGVSGGLVERISEFHKEETTGLNGRQSRNRQPPVLTHR